MPEVVGSIFIYSIIVYIHIMGRGSARHRKPTNEYWNNRSFHRFRIYVVADNIVVKGRA
ncbi:MAG: hypothetical protein IPL35_04770 [Sphingobacteriales bacterium]|nr:hypothetical protein [Sphingobacteriales bacterium]